MEQKDFLRNTDWDPTKQNIVFIHGYAGGDGIFPAVILRDGDESTLLCAYYTAIIFCYYSNYLIFFILAYIKNGSYNVFVVDWGPLAKTPCYPAAVHNIKTVAQCTAHLFNFIRDMGVPSFKITCVGHSLGAHTCGLISNHLLFRMHRIIGGKIIYRPLKRMPSTGIFKI